MVLRILLFLVVHHILNAVFDLSAPAEDQLDLLLAVVNRLKVEAVIVAHGQRLEDGGQSADRVVQRWLRLTELPPLPAALQIRTTAHGEVVFHVLPQECLVEELAVPAADLFRGGVGDVLVAFLPPHAVPPRLHALNELLPIIAQLHGPLDVLSQFLLPGGDPVGVRFRLCDRQTVLQTQLVGELFGLLHLSGALMELLARLEIHGVHNDVVVDVIGVHVGGHHALVALEVSRKLQPDLMGRRKVQRIVRREGLDDMVVPPAIGFVELLLHRLELIQRRLRHAVDAGDERVGGLLPVGHIVQDAA